MVWKRLQYFYVDQAYLNSFIFTTRWDESECFEPAVNKEDITSTVWWQQSNLHLLKMCTEMNQSMYQMNLVLFL